jgi:SAM-dependent methyltransferase
VYTRDYYFRNTEGPSVQAAPAFTELLGHEFRPKRVIDVGCGTGALLEALARAGCECVGLEYAAAGLAMCRARGLDVRRFDLERDAWAGGASPFDVAISLEVAEHLPGHAADRYVDLLVRLAPVIVFSAATVGQGGADHVNEQPHGYWIARFEARGCRYEAEVSRRWRCRLERAAVATYYSANLMIFRRPGAAEARPDQSSAPAG